MSVMQNTAKEWDERAQKCIWEKKRWKLGLYRSPQCNKSHWYQTTIPTWVEDTSVSLSWATLVYKCTRFQYFRLSLPAMSQNIGNLYIPLVEIFAQRFFDGSLQHKTTNKIIRIAWLVHPIVLKMLIENNLNWNKPLTCLVWLQLNRWVWFMSSPNQKVPKKPLRQSAQLGSDAGIVV